MNSVEEVQRLWELSGYKPKLIISDVMCFTGAILSKVFNIPCIILDPIFPLSTEEDLYYINN